MGAGINSGLGYLGEMGSTKRHSYDVLGDAVSTAARIESKCKEYGCLLLVGGDTVKHCEDDFFFLQIDKLVAKGKTDAVDIYTVLDRTKSHYAASRRRHDGMHKMYRDRRWDEAAEECKKLTGQFEGRLDLYYEMWIKRCNEMKHSDLPDDWDGRYITTTK